MRKTRKDNILILIKLIEPSFYPNSGKKISRGLFKCYCGVLFKSNIGDVKRGKTSSCGCYRRKILEEASKYQGRNPRLYTTWAGMKNRCLNKNGKNYKHYGGRGITFCERWKEFKNFHDDMFPSFKEGLQLDRIDNNNGYSPENCRWVTSKENRRNVRNNRIITYRGSKYVMAALCEKFGINTKCFVTRLKMGWDVEKSIETPVKKKFKKRN